MRPDPERLTGHDIRRAVERLERFRAAVPPEPLQRGETAVPARLRSGMRRAEDYHEWLERRISRRQALKRIGVIGAGAALGPFLWTRPGRAAEPPRGLHLTYGTDPRSEMTVSWLTSGPVQAPLVDVGVDETYGLTISAQSLTYKGGTTVQHHATLRGGGIEPGKTYHYRVRHDGGATPDLTFRTAPADAKPFRATFFGDQGTTTTGGTSVFAAAAAARVGEIAPAFHVVAGDLSYADGTQATWDAWQEQNAAVASRLPWMPTLGNHEIEVGFGTRGYDSYQARFRLPSNGVTTTPERGSAFYSFRYGNAVFVVLDGNDAAAEAGVNRNKNYAKAQQDPWLEATLKAAREDPGVSWIVVAFHNCMFSTDAVHGSDSGCRARWQPVFDRYTVDLVLNGHNHAYERTHPIRGGLFVPRLPGEETEPDLMGTTYVCAGGGGSLALPYAAHTFPLGIVNGDSKSAEPAPWSARRHPGYGVGVIDVDPAAVEGTTTLTVSLQDYSVPGSPEIDRFVLRRPAPKV